MRTPSIMQLVKRYVASRDICEIYAARLETRAERLAKFIGTNAIGKLFTEDAVNDFLASLSFSPRTIRSYREDLLSLWNGAADLDLAPYPRARRIRRPKCPELVVECYTVEEARAILAHAKNCHPYVMRTTGIDRRLYWTAAIMLAWDSGLRRGDVWAFRKSWIRPDGTARVVQRKTKQAVTVALHPSTIAALAAIPYDQACRWPGTSSNPSRFGRQFKAIARAAGVNRGTFRWLRRSSGSYVELQQPGAGSKHLGQACPQVFTKHYDARLGGHTLPLPPDLCAEGGAA